MTLPTVLFPDAGVSTWSIFNKNSASGLFAYRHMQASGLLQLPDMGDSDMTLEERRMTLKALVCQQQPLTALTIFLGVVALEDYVRDLGARMADDSNISSHFSHLIKLRAKSIVRTADQSFKRLDTDPISSIDPAEINSLLRKSLNIEPIAVAEYPRLRDLTLIRHTVAHHAAVIRSIDIPRFQYYIFKPQQPINPPADFVDETLLYLYKTGRTIENSIRDRVFSVVIPTLDTNWWNTRPPKLLQLIEFFDFFGYIETAIGPVGYSQPGTPENDRMKADGARIKENLFARCIETLRNQFCY